MPLPACRGRVGHASIRSDQERAVRTFPPPAVHMGTRAPPVRRSATPPLPHTTRTLFFDRGCIIPRIPHLPPLRHRLCVQQSRRPPPPQPVPFTPRRPSGPHPPALHTVHVVYGWHCCVPTHSPADAGPGGIRRTYVVSSRAPARSPAAANRAHEHGRPSPPRPVKPLCTRFRSYCHTHDLILSREGAASSRNPLHSPGSAAGAPTMQSLQCHHHRCACVPLRCDQKQCISYPFLSPCVDPHPVLPPPSIHHAQVYALRPGTLRGFTLRTPQHVLTARHISRRSPPAAAKTAAPQIHGDSFDF